MAALAMGAGVKLDQPPTDSVSDLDFFSGGPIIAASSWDNSIRFWRSPDLFTTAAPQLIQTQQDDTKDAILRCAFHGSEPTLFYGTARGLVKALPADGKPSEIGKHSHIVTGLSWCAAKGAVVTGSTDSTVRVFDPRAPGKEQLQIAIAGKVVALDVREAKIAVAVPDAKFYLCDLAQPSGNPIANQTQVQRPTGIAFTQSGFAIGGATGEVEITGKLFGCHQGQGVAHASNCLKAAPDGSIVLSAGGDGGVAIFDIAKGAKAERGITKASGITAVALGGDRKTYAAAAGYDWQMGIDEYTKQRPPVEIWVKKFAANEVG